MEGLVATRGRLSMKWLRGVVNGVLAERDPSIARAMARAILPDLAELARRLERVRRTDPALAVDFGPDVDRVIRIAGQDPDGLAFGFVPEV